MLQKIVLITGANQGLGLEVSKKLARKQPNYTIFMGSRDPQKGEAAAKSLSDFAPGSSVQAIELDVCSNDSIAACVSHIETTYSRLDVLVSNAGIGSRRSKGQTRQHLQMRLETNALGAACVTDACIPLLTKATVPRVVFISSGLGSLTDTVDPNWMFYGHDRQGYKSSKACMNMIGATSAVRHAKDGFKINMCDPGYCAMNLNNNAKAAGKASEGGINACQLAALGSDGENTTFSDKAGPLPW